MKVRGYILANVGLAALAGLFNGPALYLWGKTKKLRTWLKAKPQADKWT